MSTESISNAKPTETISNRHPFLCIATRVYNYAEWLPEWFEYHRLVGVDQFFVMDDCSDDNGATHNVLNFYASIGFIQYTLFQGDCHKERLRPNETELIERAFQKARNASCRWTIVMDADEYLTLRDEFKNSSVQKILMESSTPWLILDWWNIDGANLTRKPIGLTIENYHLGILQPAHFKTAAITSHVECWGFSLHPLYWSPRSLMESFRTALETPWEGYLSSAVIVEDSRGVPIVVPYSNQYGAISEDNLIAAPRQPLYIKHFMFRSLDEYMRSRGVLRLTSNSDSSPWYNNTDAWREYHGRAEISPEFTRTMAVMVNEVMQRRLKPVWPHKKR